MDLVRRCTNHAHVRLPPSSTWSESFGGHVEGICVTCLTTNHRTWPAHVLSAHIHQLCTALHTTLSAAAAIPCTHAHALMELTGCLFQRVSTPASLETECEIEEQRLRAAFFRWLRALYAPEVPLGGEGQANSSPLRCVSQGEPCLLGVAQDTDNHRASQVPPSLGACVTELLLDQLCVSIRCTSATATISPAACMLLMTDLCAQDDAAGEGFLHHLCANHLDEALTLLRTVTHLGMDGMLMELLLFWIHQVCVRCRRTPEFLEQLAVSCVPSGFTDALMTCLADWADSEPVVLNALSILSVLLDAETTAHHLVPPATTSSPPTDRDLSPLDALLDQAEDDGNGGTSAPRRGADLSWDGLMRPVVPLLLHRSAAVVVLASEVIQRVVARGTRANGVSLHLLEWVEDCALEVASAAECVTGRAVLALLSTLQSGPQQVRAVSGARQARALRVFFQFAELPSDVWVEAHSCPYFAAHLSSAVKHSGVDAESFATQALRQRLRGDHHCPSVASSCFLQEVRWLCVCQRRATALLPETLAALAHALLSIFDIGTTQNPFDALCRAAEDRPSTWPNTLSEVDVLLCVMEAVVWLSAATLASTSLATLGAFALNHFCCSTAHAAESSFSQSPWTEDLWRPAGRLLAWLLRATGGCGGVACDTGLASHLVRQLLQHGAVDLLLASPASRRHPTFSLDTGTPPTPLPATVSEEVGAEAPGRMGNTASWKLDVVAALLCGAPFSSPVTTRRLTEEAYTCADLVDFGEYSTDGSADALLCSLTAWGCPVAGVTEEQLARRVMRRRARCQFPPSMYSQQPVAHQMDTTASADGTSCDAHASASEWMCMVKGLVMLLWTHHQRFGRLPVAAAAVESRDNGTAPGASSGLDVSALLEYPCRQAWRPFMLWWSSMLAVAGADLCVFLAALASCEEWQPLVCAVLLVCHLEPTSVPPYVTAKAAEKRHNSGLAQDRSPWWLHAISASPVVPTPTPTVRVPPPSPPLHALVALALTHVQRVWGFQPHTSLTVASQRHDAASLLTLTENILSHTQTHSVTETDCDATCALAGSLHPNALHRQVLVKHLRPLLLLSAPLADLQNVPSNLSLDAPDAQGLEDALGATLVAALAGLGHKEVDAVSVLVLGHAVPTLRARLAWWSHVVSQADLAPQRGSALRSLTVWLQLAYMECWGAACDSQGEVLRAHALTLVPSLSRLEQQTLSLLLTSAKEDEDRDTMLNASAVMALGALLRVSLHNTLPCGHELHNTKQSPSLWWTLLPFTDIHRALTGTAMSGGRDGPISFEAALTTPSLPQWQCVLFLLHALSQFVFVTEMPSAWSTHQVGAARTSVVAEELSALEIVLEWSFAVLSATGHITSARAHLDLSPVTHLVNELLHRYRCTLAGTLHSLALCATCRSGAGVFTVRELGWMVCGVLQAAPCQHWLLALPPPSRARAMCELLECYGTAIAEAAHKRPQRRGSNHSAEKSLLAHTLTCAAQRFFAAVMSEIPPSLRRVKDFLCPPCTQASAASASDSVVDVTTAPLVFYPVRTRDVTIFLVVPPSASVQRHAR